MWHWCEAVSQSPRQLREVDGLQNKLASTISCRRRERTDWDVRLDSSALSLEADAEGSEPKRMVNADGAAFNYEDGGDRRI